MGQVSRPGITGLTQQHNKLQNELPNHLTCPISTSGQLFPFIPFGSPFHSARPSQLEDQLVTCPAPTWGSHQHLFLWHLTSQWELGLLDTRSSFSSSIHHAASRLWAMVLALPCTWSLCPPKSILSFRIVLFIPCRKPSLPIPAKARARGPHSVIPNPAHLTLY